VVPPLVLFMDKTRGGNTVPPLNFVYGLSLGAISTRRITGLLRILPLALDLYRNGSLPILEDENYVYRAMASGWAGLGFRTNTAVQC